MELWQNMKLFLLTLAVLVSVFLVGQAKLTLLQWVFRHGDRAPEQLYPNDPNGKDTWPGGLGSLTLLGKRQHYVLGKQLRQLYSDFITSDPNEVFVRSTGLDRCLQSAQRHLAGLYSTTQDWPISPDIPTIHYDSQNEDKILNPFRSCPKVDGEAMRIYRSEGFRHFQEENEPMLRNLSSCAGKDLDRNTALMLAATLQLEKNQNLEIPACFLPYYEQLQTFREISQNLIFHSPLILRLRAGPLLGEILDKMKQKVAGKIPDFKVQIFSARDSSLMAMLSALGNFQPDMPPFCGTLLFELHQADDSFSVRLLFFNSTRPEDGNQQPYVLQLPGCEEFCPFEHFDDHVTSLVPGDWDAECGRQQHNNNNNRQNKNRPTKRPSDEPIFYV